MSNNGFPSIDLSGYTYKSDNAYDKNYNRRVVVAASLELIRAGMLAPTSAAEPFTALGKTTPLDNLQLYVDKIEAALQVKG